MIARPGSFKISYKNPDLSRQDLPMTAIVHLPNFLPDILWSTKIIDGIRCTHVREQRKKRMMSWSEKESSAICPCEKRLNNGATERKLLKNP